MRRYLIIAFLIFLLFVSYLYWQTENEMLLLFIPAASILSLRYLGTVSKHCLVGLFILFFFISSLLLYTDSRDYNLFGVISFVLLFTIVIIKIMEYAGEKNAQ